jgi:hypothetical protein
MGGNIPVRIENLSEVPYDGSSSLAVNQPSAVGSMHGLGRQPLSLAPWETKTVQFRWSEKKPGPYGAYFDLTAGEPAPLNQTMSILFPRLIPVDEPSLPPAGAVLSDYKVIADGDAKVAAEQSLSIVDAPEGLPVSGTKVLKITYRLDAGWRFIRLAPQGEETRRIESTQDSMPKQFGLWVYGDGAGHAARLRFVDSTGQTFQSDGGKIDWNGWHYVTFPLSGVQLPHWGGTNDGVIRYPIRWDTLFLLDNVSRQPVEGEIYLSAPTLIY